MSSGNGCYGFHFSVVGCIGVNFRCLFWWVSIVGVSLLVFVFRCYVYIRRLLVVLHVSPVSVRLVHGFGVQ